MEITVPEVEEKNPPAVLLDIDSTTIYGLGNDTLQDNMPLMATIRHLQKEQNASCYISTARTALQVYTLVLEKLKKVIENNPTQQPLSKEDVKHHTEYLATHKFVERAHQFITTETVLSKGDYVMQGREGGSYYENFLKPFEENLIRFFIKLLTDEEKGVDQQLQILKDLLNPKVESTKKGKLSNEVNELLEEANKSKIITFTVKLLEDINALTPPEYSKDGLEKYQEKLRDYFNATYELCYQQKITLDTDIEQALKKAVNKLKYQRIGILPFQRFELLLTHNDFLKKPEDTNYEDFLRLEWTALHQIDNKENTKLAQALRVESGKTEDTTFVHIDDSLDELKDTLNTAEKKNLKNVVCMQVIFREDKVGLSEYTGEDTPSRTEARHEQVEEEEDQHNISAGIINDCFPFYLDENTKNQLTSLTERLIDSSPYANIYYDSFSIDENKVTFEVRVEAQQSEEVLSDEARFEAQQSEEVLSEADEQTPLVERDQTSAPPPPTLNLKFAYNTQSDAWDIEQSSQSTPSEKEKQATSELLYGYIDAGYPAANLEDCYHQMTRLQQQMLDLYSEQYLTSVGFDEEERGELYTPLGTLIGISSKKTIKIQSKMRDIMRSLNTLEDKVFKILTQLDQQGYLDDPQGKNIIEQLLKETERNGIIEKHAGTATYNPQASTLACLKEYKGTFVGSSDSSPDNPDLWSTPRINLMEELLAACINHANKEEQSEAGAKIRWLMGVKTLLHGIIDSKNTLTASYNALSNQSLGNGSMSQFHGYRHRYDLPGTLNQIQILQENINTETNEHTKKTLVGEKNTLLGFVVEKINELLKKEREGNYSFSPQEHAAIQKLIDNDILSHNNILVRHDTMSDKQVTELITIAGQFPCFQWTPAEIDRSLKNIQRNTIHGLTSLKPSSSKTPSDGTNWQNAAMVGGAVLGIVTMTVLTVGTAGGLPAGMAILGAAGYATWQVCLMIAASGVGGAIIGWGGNKMANAWSSKAKEALPKVEQAEFKAEPPPSPQSLEEELKEYSTQQLRKAFFSTINEESPIEIDRRKAVREEILDSRAPKLFNRMFNVIDIDGDPPKDGDYVAQDLKRNCFNRRDFLVVGNPDRPLAISR